MQAKFRSETEKRAKGLRPFSRTFGACRSVVWAENDQEADLMFLKIRVWRRMGLLPRHQQIVRPLRGDELRA